MADLRGLLLERDRELRALAAAVDAASAGSGRLIVIEADAGMGKSSLLDAAADIAEEQGVIVLRAEGTLHEQALPFGGVFQLFDAVVRNASPAERVQLLSGPAALAADLLSGARLSSLPDDQLVLSVTHGLYWLTANLCLGAGDADRRPALILVDDAHQLDRGTVGFLTYMSRRLDDLPVSMVVATRPHPQAPTADLAPNRADGAILLSPANLSATAVEDLLVSEFPGQPIDPGLPAGCLAVTGGNPFLVRELVSELRLSGITMGAEGTERVRHLIPQSVLKATLGRLAHLGEPATGIARIVAVMGDDADEQVIADMLGADPDSVAASVEQLRIAGIFGHQAHIRFTHSLLRSSVESDLSAGTRESIEREGARALARRKAPDFRVAAHLLGSARAADAWTVEVLERAARHARQRGAPDVAARFLQRAIDEPPPLSGRARILGSLAEAEAATGQGSALGHLEQALALMPSASERKALLASMGRILWAAGEHQESARCFRRAVAENDGADGPEARELKARAAVAAHQTGMSLDIVDDVLGDLEEGLRDPVAGERALLGLLAARNALRGAAKTAIDEHLDRVLASEVEAYELLAEGGMLLTVSGVALLHSDRLDDLMLLAQKAAEMAREEGSVLALATSSYMKTWAGYFRGELAEARADAQFALDARSFGWRMQVGAACAVLAHASVEAGDLDAAQIALADADSSGLHPQAAEHSLLLIAKGHYELARQNPHAALDHLNGSASRDQALLVAARPISWRVLAVEAAIAAGDQSLAAQFAREELARAQAIGAPRTLGMALRACGLVERGSQRIELLQRSVSVLESSPSQLELARALVDLGAALRSAGRRAECRAPLSRGLDLASSFGAAPLAERALQELAGAGARPRRLAVAGPASLTPGEQRVARLAAAGSTNREIAQMLFVSTKAVEYHMGNVLRKLGISSREQLENALAGRTERLRDDP